MIKYYAHSAPKGLNKDNRKSWQLVSKHLCNVAEMVFEFTEKYHFKHEAIIAALLHDIGKYSVNFQKRLEGKASGINHWSAGARIAMEHGTYAAAFAIYGHHVGLPRADKIDPAWIDEESEIWGIAENYRELFSRFQIDQLSIPILKKEERITSASNISFQLATRNWTGLSLLFLI